MGERQFGPYKLVRQIAVGGMAEIHLAKAAGIAGFEKYVALKMIHPNFAEDDQFIEMLVDEAKIAVQLTHGNIAQTFDLGRVGDTYYITMEYVDGADLYKILRRASEQDLEMPLDVCAFIGKEISSALDHAHRKRDHTGRHLKIVHRDVSPQNVLVSYAGEVKLVDFGIAKATMKVRQTAVGVIKGKYYYMSPEQAKGLAIDHRSDIFSAGIVLYEMITGQMLYLEEDLQKLLDMARAADIAPPSKLRKGVPPQLERIVMHALAKNPADRYQTAGDFATDLERFLHAYSPVFTAGKLSSLLRQVVGDPMQVPDDPSSAMIEVRDGKFATHPLTDAELAHASDKDDLRDENSVLFKPAELDPGKPQAARVTRAAAPDPADIVADPRMVPKRPASRPPAAAKPRSPHEETRQLRQAPTSSEDDTSGLLTREGGKLAWDRSDASDTHDEDLDGAGERTVITGGPTGMTGFMMDVAGDGPIEATLVTGAPQPEPEPPEPPEPPDDDYDETLMRRAHEPADDDSTDEEGPTLARDFATDRTTAPARPRANRTQPPPAALAAKIHAPAVSELRRPRPSRRTPPDGVAAQPNVLQAIVGAQTSEPMPVPRGTAPQARQSATPPSAVPLATPGAQPTYTPANQAPGVPPHLQPYLHVQLPPNYSAQQAGGYPGVRPGALYGMQPPPQPASLTGQMRLFEVDEIPSHYKLRSARNRLFTYIVAGVLAVSVAAGVTFFIIRSTRESAPTIGSVHIESVPAGAEVTFDGTRLSDKTPLTVDGVPVGSRHTLRIELARHKPYDDSIDIPKTGGEVPVMALLKPITGKLVIESNPEGAEVRINDQLRGRTPTTITDVDMSSARHVELRLKDYQPYLQDLDWPANGTIQINARLSK